MNVVFRLARVLLRLLGSSAPPMPPFGEARLRFRILPHDLDLNFHVNNARYLSFMDLGRVDLMGRLGLFRFAFRGR
jgi:thioesterase superfamily protein